MGGRTRKLAARVTGGLEHRKRLQERLQERRTRCNQTASLETHPKWKPQSTTLVLVSGGHEWKWKTDGAPIHDQSSTPESSTPDYVRRYRRAIADIYLRFADSSSGEMLRATHSYTVNYNLTKWSDSPSEMAEYQHQQLVQFEKDTVTAIEKKRKKDVREAKKVAQKAGKDSLARLKAQIDDPDWTCPICFEKNYVRSILSCKHMYCTDCWTECKNHRIGECPQCPQCREPQF